MAIPMIGGGQAAPEWHKKIAEDLYKKRCKIRLVEKEIPEFIGIVHGIDIFDQAAWLKIGILDVESGGIAEFIWLRMAEIRNIRVTE